MSRACHWSWLSRFHQQLMLRQLVDWQSFRFTSKLLKPGTTLPVYVSNPSILCHGLKSFCISTISVAASAKKGMIYDFYHSWLCALLDMTYALATKLIARISFQNGEANGRGGIQWCERVIGRDTKGEMEDLLVTKQPAKWWRNGSANMMMEFMNGR